MKAIQKKFYSNFWENQNCRNIFSVHKTQLLENEVELILSKEDFLAQRLVLTNLNDKFGDNVIRRTEDESIDVLDAISNSIKKYLKQEKIDRYIERSIGKGISEIGNRMNEVGPFSFVVSIVKKIKKDNDIFPTLSDLGFIPSDVKSTVDFEQYLFNGFKKIKSEYLKEHNLTDLANSIDFFTTYYYNKVKSSLVRGSTHQSNILFSGENLKSRLSFFDSLYDIGVLIGGKHKSYYECVTCSPNTLNGILTIDVAPSKLKMKCPACNKELLYMVPYEIDENIYRDIDNKDGLLFSALKFLFESKDCFFKSNQTFLNDIELDFCLYKKVQTDRMQMSEIVEVKMFKTNTPLDTQMNNLKLAVKKLKSATDKLVKHQAPSFQLVHKSLVTNISNGQVLASVKSEISNDLKEYNIKIYSINEYHNYFLNN